MTLNDVVLKLERDDIKVAELEEFRSVVSKFGLFSDANCVSEFLSRYEQFRKNIHSNLPMVVECANFG